MDSSPDNSKFPNSESPELHLSHPTKQESIKISTLTASSWKDSLTLPLYLQESHFLTTIPLAKEGGMTNWILTIKSLSPNERPILCSCETFRKHSLISHGNGKIQDVIIHGVASVFCSANFRRRGYASRMMRELKVVLRNWQTDQFTCIGSILYSDIGKSYYAKLGWKPSPTNTEIIFQKPSNLSGTTELSARCISMQDLPMLCKTDESMIRKAMATPFAEGIERRVTVFPDLDHIIWHISKEEFACDVIFGKVPYTKGAVAGPPGNRVWAVWTRRYFSNPKAHIGDNTLYIVRLVIEEAEHEPGSLDSPPACQVDSHSTLHNQQVAYLKAVLQAAQDEAMWWDLDYVKIWDLKPEILNMIVQTGMEHSVVERDGGIASSIWYDENCEEELQWINTEYFSWC